MIKNNYKKFILVLVSFIIGYLCALFNCKLETWIDFSSGHQELRLKLFPFQKKYELSWPFERNVYLPSASDRDKDWLYWYRTDFRNHIPLYPDRCVITSGDLFASAIMRLYNAMELLELSPEEKKAVMSKFLEYSRTEGTRSAQKYAHEMYIEGLKKFGEKTGTPWSETSSPEYDEGDEIK